MMYEIFNRELGNDLSVPVHTHMKNLQKPGTQSQCFNQHSDVLPYLKGNVKY